MRRTSREAWRSRAGDGDGGVDDVCGRHVDGRLGYARGYVTHVHVQLGFTYMGLRETRVRDVASMWNPRWF